MRTLRETAGWGLTIALWAYPLAAPALVIAWLVGELPLGVGLLTLLAGLAWPGLVLTAIRLRAPDPLEVAEADGRRPVVLFHAFARSDLPWFERLLLVSPGFWRDLADHLQERALVRSLSAVGPVLPVARPAPAPDHGPVRALDASGWEARLRRPLRRARLLAVVLDGRQTDLRALSMGRDLLGLSRVLLVPPARLTGAFMERWAALVESAREALPAITPRSVAFRYSAQETVEALEARSPGLLARLSLLRQPDLMLREGEPVVGPKRPSYAPFVAILPVGAALIGALALPEMLESYHRIRLHGDAVPMGLLLFGLGVAIAVSSRRVWRLVPGSELPLVALASAPWWGAELVTWLDGASLSRRLKAAAIGAAYSMPLLFSVAVLLALSTLARRTPHRSGKFAVFGLAALVPFLPLGATLDDASAQAAMFGMAIVASAVILPLVFWAASGDAGRRHAPLPLGASVAVGLGLAAAGTVAAHVAWRRALARDRFAETAVPLTLWDDAWPWFLLAIPVTATVLAVAFRGRATRVSIGNLSTLAPLMLIVALVSGAHAEARARIAASAAGSVEDLLRPVLGEGARGLALPEMVADEDAQQPVEIALDARGAIVGGAYVAHPGQLSTGRGSVALARAVALAARDGVVTVAVDREVQLDAVRGLAALAFREGAGELHVVVRRPDGGAGLVRLHDRRPNPGHVHLTMRVSHDGVILADTGGYRFDIPARGGAQDDGGVSLRLSQYRAQVPARRVLLIGGRHARWGVVAPLCRTAVAHFPELALVDL